MIYLRSFYIPGKKYLIQDKQKIFSNYENFIESLNRLGKSALECDRWRAKICQLVLQNIIPLTEQYTIKLVFKCDDFVTIKNDQNQ